VFIGGLLLVAAASLAAGFSANEGQLIAARAAQGLGAAIISPAALSIVTTTFRDGAERNKALGAWGAVAGAGGAAGVLLGGILTEGLGWEWVLWVNVPIGVLAAFLAPRLLDESRREGGTRHFDAIGAVTITAGLSLLVYALVDAVSAGWGSTKTLSLLAVSLALIALFMFLELRSREPLVPFSIFRIRTITGSNLVGLLVGASLFAMFFFLSRYMQEVLGYSALKAGLSYLPLAIAIIVSAGIASVLVTKFGFKPILLLGMGLVTIALLWFGQVPVQGDYVTDLLGPMIIAAVGLGFAFVPVTIGAMTGVSEDESGLASGLINTSQQVGGALGLAVLGSIASSKTTDLLASAQGAPSAIPGALTEGFQIAFMVGAVFAVIAIITTLVLIRNEDSKAVVGASPADLPLA
jgi:EmrB/QacA subfamily drug resistance transporter